MFSIHYFRPDDVNVIFDDIFQDVIRHNFIFDLLLMYRTIVIELNLTKIMTYNVLFSKMSKIY